MQPEYQGHGEMQPEYQGHGEIQPEYQGREAVKFFKVFQPLKARPPQTLGDLFCLQRCGPLYPVLPSYQRHFSRKPVFEHREARRNPPGVPGAPREPRRGYREARRNAAGVPGARSCEIFQSFSTVEGKASPDPRGPILPSTVRTALPRPSKLPSARFQKPSFRKQRPPDSGPDRPQDRLPTPGGPCPGSLRRNRPVQTAVLCESAPARTRRSIGKRDPPSEGPRRPASRRRSGGRFLRPAGSPLRPGRASARRGSEGTLPPRSSRAPTAR